MATGAPLPVREYATADEMRRHAAEVRARMFGPEQKPVRLPKKPPAPESRPDPHNYPERFIPPKPARPEDFEKRPLQRMRCLIDMVADKTGVTSLEIVSQRRLARPTKARQIVFWLAREFTTLSLPQIGYRVGRRDHSTALWGARKVQKVIELLDIERSDCPTAMAERLWAADWPSVPK